MARLTRVSMREGWETEARNWAYIARTPGADHAHEEINRPALLDLLPSRSHRVLDMACGEGRISRLLASLGHRVVGIDASPTMVRFAATHPAAPPTVLADATALPFGEKAFDLVVAYMCLQDVDDMPRAVAEAARVLDSAGRMCLAIPHPINTAGAFRERDRAAPFVISGSYLERRRFSFTVERDGVRLTFHNEHRPMEVYIHALAAAGLLTETIREVGCPDQVAARDAESGRWQRIPLFLHLRAVKH